MTRVTFPTHDDFPGWVERLADPIRAKRAYRHLIGSGPAALPAVRDGLRHASPDVRALCTRVLDHLADAATFPSLLAMVDDPAAEVRLHALHALACDRCKESNIRTRDALTPGLEHLRADPDRHVRAMAVELVGRYVHAEPSAAAALCEARERDPDPTVRKKAGWYAPGGTIYRKTRPRSSTSERDAARAAR